MRIIVGLQGVQGSGKSTVARQLTGGGWEALSMDDFYLPADEMSVAFRGHPGTHDVAWMERVLRAFKNEEDEIVVPVYDKSLREGLGDRAGCRLLDGSASQLLLEGWCLGFEGRDDNADDPVDRHVRHYADHIHPLLDAMMILRPLSFDIAHAWRASAEPSNGMNEEQLRRFVDHYMPLYERYCPALYANPPVRPSLLLDLNDRREVHAIGNLFLA